MGKNAGARKRSTDPSTNPVASFFSPAGTRWGGAAENNGAEKMAAATEPVERDPIDAIPRSEWHTELAGGFQKMEEALSNKLTTLIAPIAAQLQDLKQNLEQVSQTAEAAMELAITNQESSKQMQTHQEWATEKIIAMENQMKMKNLKLRGFPEGSEENTELRVFVSNWLANQMQLEEGVAPLLDAAYRLGPMRRASNALPRDILIRCSDLRTKQKIMTLTRSKGHLLFHSYKIQVLQDLLFETLEARRKMKPLTSLLSKEKIKYRWQAVTKVQVVHKGASMIAYDLDSAVPLLEGLGLEVPEDFYVTPSPKKREDWKPA